GKLADGGLVAYDLKLDAFEEDCRRAVLIMTIRDPPPDCRAQVIGRSLLRQRGALALHRTGSGFAIDAARPPNFDRPWAPQKLRATETANPTPTRPAASQVAPRDATPRQEDIEADQSGAVIPGPSAARNPESIITGYADLALSLPCKTGVMD